MTAQAPTHCTHCGANLSIEDMRAPTCRFCGTVLAHHARAMEKVAVVQGIMGGMLGGMAPPMAGGPLPPMQGNAVVVTSGSAVVMVSTNSAGGPVAPPMHGHPMGGARPGVPMMMYGHPAAMHAVDHAQRGIRRMVLGIVIFSVVIMVLVGAGIAVFAVMAR
jgi:hypothetical protein